MKLSIVMLAVLGYPSSVALWAAETPRSTCDSLTGVWDYVEPSPAGRAVIAKLGTKYTIAFIQAPSPAGAPEPATDAEKAARYSASGAGAFDYSCDGSNGKFRMQMRVLHSLRPQEVGSSLTCELELQGDTATWWFLDAAGKRGAPGSAKRLK